MLRCPKCGGMPTIMWRGVGQNPKAYGPLYRLYFVKCRDPECRVNPSGPERLTESEAEQAWNEQVSEYNRTYGVKG